MSEQLRFPCRNVNFKTARKVAFRMPKRHCQNGGVSHAGTSSLEPARKMAFRMPKRHLSVQKGGVSHAKNE